MAVTPAEAKTKWCPFAHVANSPGGGTLSQGQPSFNRVDRGDGFSLIPMAACCVADACMQWRWARVRVPPDDPEARDLGPHATRPSATHGDCGLGGPT